MLGLFAPLEVLDEGFEEAFQAGQDAAGGAGVDFGVGQELVQAGGTAAFHRQFLPRTPFTGRALYEITWPPSSKGHSRSRRPRGVAPAGHADRHPSRRVPLIGKPVAAIARMVHLTRR